MHKRTFSTFSGASNFARQHAQEIGATVKLDREGNNWVVFTSKRAEPPIQGQHTPRRSHPEYQPNNDRWKRHREVQRKREEQRRALKQKAREAEVREREKRRPYLEERETYYRSLTEKELENQWNQREEKGLEPDETALLREIVREVKGIKPAHGNSAQVCRQCGMVGENCTCSQSWF